ncbi:DUF211 domain-containing protein [Paraglaciecola arctica]|uniref:DUF211 domain-containing protein n=1 Tax=Paraglaciecola arctica BSs20135 TaxID=493475 RepID=K6Y0B9_9ALTE|nr:DUF211 domain-containing protein [Paraglaciecola arctica]GAC17311.1 hypothetical protein GARC_0329 [Paraglaciecola arctica BSs20135]
MAIIRRIILDVLKPHQPKASEFAMTLADLGNEYQVHLAVIEVDENTESVQLEIKAPNINFELVQAAIIDMGASLHSIDEVDAISQSKFSQQD